MTDENEDRDEGLFSRAKKATRAMVASGRAPQREQTSALTRSMQENFTKLGEVVATGKDVQTDAQNVLFFLASYGVAEKIGQYAFSSSELCGAPGRTAYREGSEGERIAVDIPAVDKVMALDIDGPRLRNAVTLLKSRGWAITTEDGDFAPGTDFHEVSLTAAGRAAAQSYVKGRMAASVDDAFPSFFDSPAAGAAPATTELNQLQAMLARAHVKFAVDHAEADKREDTTSTVAVSDVEFTFDADGKLTGVGKT